MADDRRDLTSGDPLGGGTPAPPPTAPAPSPTSTGSWPAVDAPSPERPVAYGGGPVPPGAFAPRPERPGKPRPEDLAEWWRRALATIVDSVIVGGITLLVLAVAGAGFFADGDLGTGELIVGGILFVVLFAALALLYAPLVMARTNGSTLGKLATGCRVVRLDGKPTDFWWSALREVVVKGLLIGIASSLTGGIAYLVDVLWPLWDKENRAVHDFLVSSRVVRR